MPSLALELWRGFIFVNFDRNASPLAPTLERYEPFVEHYHLDNCFCPGTFTLRDLTSRCVISRRTHAIFFAHYRAVIARPVFIHRKGHEEACKNPLRAGNTRVPPGRFELPTYRLGGGRSIP